MIILTTKSIIIIIILFILFFSLGYRIATIKASKMYARFLLEQQKGNVKIKIVEIKEEKKEK